MNTDLSYYADIIGIVSGVMSIVGISGILGWSIFGKGKNPLSRTILMFFAYSVKAFLCIVLLGVMLFVLSVPWAITVSITGGNPYPLGEWVSGVGYKSVPIHEMLLSYGNLVGTVIIGLIFVPFYILSCVCIFLWSIQPAKDFLHAVVRHKDTV